MNEVSTRQKTRILRYGVAIIAVLAAVMMRISWKSVLGTDSPFLFFFAALSIAAWYGGMSAGILATFLGTLSVAFLGLLPVSRFGGAPDIPHLLQFTLFIATGWLVSFLMGRLHVVLDRSARAEQELEQRVQERTEQLMEANRTLQDLSSELLNAQETERLRISKELHDELGQALTLVKLKIGLVENNLKANIPAAQKYCADASAHVDSAIENMRRLSRALSPVTVETLGITVALRRLSDDFNALGGIRFTSDIAPIDGILPLGSSILLYRVLQEALNNIVKHSSASMASIQIRQRDGGIYVAVSDNGRGIGSGSEEAVPSAGGLGLSIMTERVRTLGGSLQIESREGQGTKLQFTLPAKADAEAKGATGSHVAADGSDGG